jgi:histone H3/H4
MKNKIPKPPLDRIIREGSTKFCNLCGSTISKNGFLSLFGEYICHNENCKNAISNKRYK